MAKQQTISEVARLGGLARSRKIGAAGHLAASRKMVDAKRRKAEARKLLQNVPMMSKRHA